MSNQDKFHGQGGTFEVDKVSGTRKRVGDEQERHKDGDRSRNNKGEVRKEVAPVQPAVPLPPEQPAWLTPADAAKTQQKKGA